MTDVQEYALKAVDVLARRTRLAFLDMEAAKAAAPRVVKLMGTYRFQALLVGELHGTGKSNRSALSDVTCAVKMQVTCSSGRASSGHRS
jgi:hypothetical protein